MPFPSSCISLALLVFLGRLYAFAKDHGNGPRGYLKTSIRSIFRNCPISAILANRLRSILRGMSVFLALTFTTFFKCLNVLRLTFFSGSKKSIASNEEQRLSTNSLQVVSPYFLAFSKLSLILSDSGTPVDRRAL